MATNWSSFDPRKPWLLKPEDGAGQQQSPDYWKNLYGGGQQGGAPPAGTVNPAAPPPAAKPKPAVPSGGSAQPVPVSSQTVPVPPPPPPPNMHPPAPGVTGGPPPAGQVQPAAGASTADQQAAYANALAKYQANPAYANVKNIDELAAAEVLGLPGAFTGWSLEQTNAARALMGKPLATGVSGNGFDQYQPTENEYVIGAEAPGQRWSDDPAKQVSMNAGILDLFKQWADGAGGGGGGAGGGIDREPQTNPGGQPGAGTVTPGFNWDSIFGPGAGGGSGGGGAGGGGAQQPGGQQGGNVQEMGDLLAFFRDALGQGKANLPASLGGFQAPNADFDNGPGWSPTAGPARTSGGPGAAERTAAYQTAPGTFQGEALSGDLTRFAREGLANPSRYDAGLVRQGLSVADAELEKKGAAAERGLDDKMASRGLLGSSVELDENYGLRAELERQRQARAFELNREQATTYAQDRSAAGGMALGVGEFQRGLGKDRAQENQFAWGANRQAGRDAEDDRRYRAEFGEDQFRFDTTTGLAKDQMRQRESEFTRSIKDSQVRFAVDNQMKARAMELQRFGMESDVALKQAGQELEANTKAAALALQQQGMQKDDAYRYAALSQDGRFREMALKLQGEGLRLDEAFRRAELQWKQDYGNKELGLKEQSLANEERFQKVYAMLELFKMMQEGGVDPKMLSAYYKQVTGQDMPTTEDEQTDEGDTPESDPEQYSANPKALGGSKVVSTKALYGQNGPRYAITEDGSMWIMTNATKGYGETRLQWKRAGKTNTTNQG